MCTIAPEIGAIRRPHGMAARIFGPEVSVGFANSAAVWWLRVAFGPAARSTPCNAADRGTGPLNVAMTA
jgi:hypothetical protein